MAKKAGRKSDRVSAAMFIRIYIESVHAGHTIAQLAQRLGWSSGRVRGRIHFYQKRRGVSLPPLKRAARGKAGTAPLDVTALNALVRELMASPAPRGWSSVSSPVAVS